ncbi:alcohol dehydrogenase [Candidatus Methylacidiphilum fumarolicum]|uniref:Short-chain alcohol dehydrogenase n=2 Tax=Candidatus Methylacidiphilum fumarolicum TaxID=591154 RepID=I0K152_METFB|nr:SDR family NAD(P)-dependent oxidoreductase [Candidatus Methylacidiphilum fumarolicum]MBW6415986.1 SDR family NAD(P)-dependent oxidoreductase [Candidatus Methylacidiphilum fumarolicum]TFE66154.1 alcohol dehydrogenase [Candidatus Methylacidiphilum fumarolicum]TFE71739.1 alcohol dehydrogenase [Candidatus Methylacidiphilum fumarolicum]TFE71961.1 alcohol dehydrogenase [Candidatus Methylacidiphilum fumarolicum]TFE76499.1 alcohol dehydrogenase [Candidatus Methylacidiphilum fumarolicum]
MIGKEKVVLVTGGAKGLGAYLCRKLSSEDWSVVIHYYKSEEQASALEKEFEREGKKALTVQADLSKQNEARGIIDKIRTVFGRLDAVINNSGVYDAVPLELTEEKDWFRGINSTASAVLFTTLASLPLLRLSGRGRIVNIGDSSCDRIGSREMALGYHLGKIGVYLLTKSFARENARYGITVNVVSPGYLENSQGLPPLSKIPAGRYGTFEDIWRGVKFFLDEKQSYITGSHLIVSGGWNLR